MPPWATLAWANRAKIIAVAKKLQWSRRNWMRLGGLAAVAVGVYLAATYGYISRFNPTSWTNEQWAQLVVNVTGFGILYIGMRSWWGRQDEVWDEVDQLREQVDELRVALAEASEFLAEHTHEGEDEEFEPEVAPETVNAIPSARPAPPPPVVREPATTAFQAVRQAPISDRELPTVERQLGGYTFRFKAEETG